MRPKKPAPERRTRSKLVKFTPAEWETIAAAASTCAVPMSRYLRDAALGAAPRPRAEHANVLRLVARAATALVQLATRAEASGALPEAATFDSTRRELLELVQRGLGLGDSGVVPRTPSAAAVARSSGGDVERAVPLGPDSAADWNEMDRDFAAAHPAVRPLRERMGDRTTAPSPGGAPVHVPASSDATVPATVPASGSASAPMSAPISVPVSVSAT